MDIFNINVSIGILLAIIVIGYLLFRYSRKRKEKEQASNEFKNYSRVYNKQDEDNDFWNDDVNNNEISPQDFVPIKEADSDE